VEEKKKKVRHSIGMSDLLGCLFRLLGAKITSGAGYHWLQVGRGCLGTLKLGLVVLDSDALKLGSAKRSLQVKPGTRKT